MSEDEERFDDEEDNYFENLQEVQHLPADHPLMVPLQNALKGQLSKELERVDLTLREKEEHLKKLRRAREDIGVQLYGVQQQLAKMQMNYEKTRDNFNIIKKYREEAEEQLEALDEEYTKKKTEVDDQQRKVTKAQEELNQINRTLKQVEEYNQQMKSEIQLSKRMTYRAEEAVTNLEKDKKQQDILIDHMNEEIKKLTDQKNLIEAQLRSQKEQTETAQETLRDAAEQLEKIQLSKKDLLAEWKYYYLVMQQCDSKLQELQEGIGKQREQESNIDSELRGYQLLIKKENETYEKLLEAHETYKAELEQLENNSQSFKEQRRYLEEQERMLKGSKRATEKEIANMDSKKKAIEEELSNIEKSIMRLHNDTQNLILNIINNLSEKTTIEKSANNLSKQAEKLQGDIGEKNAEIESVKNDIIRVKMDVLHTEQGLEMLSEKKIEIEKELAEKEDLLKRFEKTISVNHDDLKKKQLYVDRLNKEKDKYEKSIADESSGPYEARLNHLERTIAEKEISISRMERDWISVQTSLVEKENEIQKLQSDNSDYRTRLTILEQRKLRLNATVFSVKKETAEVENSLKSLRNEMNRINVLLDKNREKYKGLEDETGHLEKDFVDRLKELERETISIDDSIEVVKKEKENVLEEIVESERQILLWERKIQLEKEMQMTIDPNVGQKEMQDMKKEIHRMKLKLESLEQKQTKLMKSMTSAVNKRETIQLKYQPKAEKGKTGASIGKQVANLKNTLKHTTQNSQQVDNSISQRKEELALLSQEIQQTKEIHEEIQEKADMISVEISALKLEKQANLWNITKYQTYAKIYQQVNEGKFKASAREETMIKEIEEEHNLFNTINSALHEISEQNPHYQVLFEKILGWE